MLLTLKKIDYTDEIILEKIFKWRNDETTRMNSLNTNIINKDIFNIIIEKYKESGIEPYIIYISDEAIGLISFVKDNNKNNSYYIGINIDVSYRGKGISKEALKICIEKIKNFKIILKAKIKKSNIASKKLFSNIFEYYNEDENFIEYIYNYHKI